jgi:2-polyprenyl-6-methoxyphenol hydroxylase-like FAD-dependent oxidoreductase
MSSANTVSRAHTPVLIVGAGPVGLVAAIRLREQGVDVRIIDEQPADSKRTYPVLLHARTLRILTSLGVTAPLEWRGRPITRLAVYTDGQRRSVLDLPAAGEMSPGAMTLPQDVLRQSLTTRLSELGTDVEWKTRLTSLAQDATRIRVGIVRRDRVEGTRPSLTPEWRDVAAESLDAEFLVGADGCTSSVRQRLGIEFVAKGHRQMYAFYDVADARAGDEAHLVLASGTTNSVYPLQSNASRFSFEIAIGISDPPGLAQLRQLLELRMPWYAAQANGFEWSGSAEFNPALAERFGEGKVWLAGDAAHSTGPLGGQSLNVGIHEADDLACRIVEQRNNVALRSLGPSYTQQRQIEWQRLFGIGSSSPCATRAQDWIKRHIASLLPSLPASGDDLDDLLEQLHVTSA